MSTVKEKQGEAADDDQLFLDQVLNQLYDFGDGENKRLRTSLKGKKSRSEKDDAEPEINTKDLVLHGTISEQHSPLLVSGNTPSVAKQAKVEVVSFIDPLKKKPAPRFTEPKLKVNDAKLKKNPLVEDKLTIEKARFEVHRFGLSGFEKQQQRLFEQDRAIMLGARPPKRQYVNYKVYQEIVKEQKREKEKGKTESQKQRRKGRNSRTDRSKSSSAREVGGQVGRFKNGILVLTSKDMEKCKN
ncbi:hypothetical protein DNTS_009772 [Danionella cerebrum]|uniref:Uncharacterized protein n=1 Tax=Danionella cerebrum TaxID=2873325 RepID=A0A553N029_9TELE|nr:hypothetical protein DNTS_009772 [Danionella translucida]